MEIKCKVCNKPVKIVNPAAAKPAQEHGIICSECRRKTATQHAFERGVEVGRRLSQYDDLPY
jgi:hypothetical protein